MPRVMTNNGYEIGYRESGSGATAIVFLHGVGSDKSVWHPQLEYFGHRVRAVAFDYPGYGESGRSPLGADHDDYASAILAAMDELEIARAHICGLSLGGVVAIAMAHAQPRRCATLTLADSFAVHPEGRAIFERSVAASDDLRAMAEARVDILLAQPADPAVRREVVETMARIDPSAYRTGARAVWLADQRQRAQAMEMPALVIVGAQDLVTPAALSDELNDLIPDSRLQVIAASGHLASLERPDEFNRAVEQFIAWNDVQLQEPEQ